MIWLLPTLPASHISLPLALPKTFPSCCSASTRIISTLKVFAAASPECSFQILFHVGYPLCMTIQRVLLCHSVKISIFQSCPRCALWDHFFQSTHNSRLIIRQMLYKYQLKYSTKYLTSQFSRSVMSDSLQPMDCSTPGFSVHHQFPELAQMHVHQAGDAIQQFHPLSSPFPPAFNLFEHQGLFT